VSGEFDRSVQELTDHVKARLNAHDDRTVEQATRWLEALERLKLGSRAETVGKIRVDERATGDGTTLVDLYVDGVLVIEGMSHEHCNVGKWRAAGFEVQWNYDEE